MPDINKRMGKSVDFPKRTKRYPIALVFDRTFECDLVVSGLDADRTFELVSGKSPKKNPNRSCSGVAIYAVLKQPLPPEIVTHSVVMPDQPSDLYGRLQKNQQPEQTMALS